MSAHSERNPYSGGFTYIALLAAIVIIGITLGSATKYWSHIALREKEKELLWRGNQYRNAIESYYRSNRPGRQPMYPPRIDELLKDSRYTNRRHLRKKYVDPVTGEDFEVVRDKARRIIGVRSTSDAEPLKQRNFPPEYVDFEGKTKYSEWKFEFVPTPVPGKSSSATKSSSTTIKTTMF